MYIIKIIVHFYFNYNAHYDYYCAFIICIITNTKCTIYSKNVLFTFNHVIVHFVAVIVHIIRIIENIMFFQQIIPNKNT